MTRTLLFLGIVVFCGASGEIAITHATKLVGEVKSVRPAHLLGWLGRAFRVGWMWFGLLLLALSFYSLLALLSWNPVSFVIPASAASYAVGVFAAKYLLGEQVSGARWAGVLLICAGVALVAWKA